MDANLLSIIRKMNREDYRVVIDFYGDNVAHVKVTKGAVSAEAFTQVTARKLPKAVEKCANTIKNTSPVVNAFSTNPSMDSDVEAAFPTSN